jgi:hypothetical protein
MAFVHLRALDRLAAVRRRARLDENVIPVAGAGLGRERVEPSGEHSVFVRVHAITS